MSKQDQRVN